MSQILFISYAADDSSLAYDLAWELELAGRRVVTDGGSVHTGADLALVLDRASPTIAILSPSYLAALRDQPALVERFRAQATGGAPTIVAVRLRECEPDALLVGVSYLDLVDADAATRRTLLATALPGDEVQSTVPSRPTVPPSVAGRAKTPAPVRRLEDVFKLSGIPTVTFVAPASFERMTDSLVHSGRGIVIEGPSGIGKTSALRHALAAVEGRAALHDVTMLNARDDEDRIAQYRSWRRGTIVIDDVHRLSPALRGRLGDHLKVLADAERQDLRIVLLGIPGTAKQLIDASFDLAGRLAVFRLLRVEDEAIHAMIEMGEQALNVRLEDKDELVRAARGSLHVAQILCYEICSRAAIRSTMPVRTRVASDVRAARSEVLTTLGAKFSDLVGAFDAVGEDIGRRLLQELARSPDGILELPRLRAERTDLADGIDRFVKADPMSHVQAIFPAYEQHILYDAEAQRLTFEDPQLAFYLRDRFGVDRNRVFISYSHEDERWERRLRVHLRPLQDDVIDLWADTRIGPGEDWRQEIRKAIETASVAVVLVSPDFMASEFIIRNELPPLLRGAQTNADTTILPVIVGPTDFEHSALARFQAVNDPARPLIVMTKAEQETVFHKVAQAVRRIVAAD